MNDMERVAGVAEFGPASVGVVASSVARRVGLSWPLLVGAITFVGLLTRGGLLGDGDTYWHIVAGRWMIQHLSIPTVDPFSYTMPGAPWVAHEWLSEIILSSAYSIGGWSGVVAVAAAAFATALAVLLRYLLRHLEPLYAVLFAAATLTLASTHLLARPHTLAAPILVYWTVSMLRAREAKRAPSLWLAALMVVWANLHGSFAFGLALCGAFGIEAVLAASGPTERWSAARQWSIFLSAALLASLANPHGIHGLTFAFELTRMKFISRIDEWRPLAFEGVVPFEIELLAAAVMVLTRGLKLPLMRLVLLLGLVHLALHHNRHLDLLALVGPAVVAEAIGAQWFAKSANGEQAAGVDRFFKSLARPAEWTTCIAVLLCLGIAAWSATRIDALHPPAFGTPSAALQKVQEAYPEGPGRVLNSYESAGYLIFSGISPFIDGRGDMYGDKFFFDYMDALDLKESNLLPDLLDRYRVTWTLLTPATPAVALMDHLPGWRRLYADKTAVVHVRSDRP